MHQDISGVLPVSVVRRDGQILIVKMSDDSYRTFSSDAHKFLGESYSSLSDIKNIGAYLRVSDEQSSALVASLVFGDEDAEDVTVVADGGPSYQPPKAVIEEAQSSSDSLRESLSEEDYAMAQALASGEPVGVEVVQWIYDYFSNNDPTDQIHGGFKGRKWAEKIIAGDGEEDRVGYDPYAKYKFEDDPDFDYMALGPDRESPLVDRLVRLDWGSDAVYIWTSAGFVPMTENDIESFDYPYVCPVDLETAQVLAKWLDQNPYDLYDPRDADPEARNLFDTAYDEIDFEEVDRFSSVIADASGYTPAKRSNNAQRQMRNTGGRFSGRQVEQTKSLKGFTKSRLPHEHPVDHKPGHTIKTWLGTLAPVTPSAEVTAVVAALKQGKSQSVAQPDADPLSHSQVHHDKASDWTGETGSESSEDEKESGLKDAIYFAIVDPNDNTAVLDLVAITRNADGEPEAWRRLKGQWKSDPGTLAQLTGATPPPVVNLKDPDVLKQVLGEVDNHDQHPGDLPTDSVSDSAPPALQASGGVLIESLDDLKAFVTYLDGEEPNAEAKAYLRRRAKAFNRLDVIPEAWRVQTLAEQGMELASESPLFGDFGEVLVAAGHPYQGAKGAERLKRYWCYGEGAAKIRWGTKGDLTRAHRHLAKFVGPDRAWGLAQNYHEAIFGMSNTKHDKLTGQYVSHHGGKH